MSQKLSSLFVQPKNGLNLIGFIDLFTKRGNFYCNQLLNVIKSVITD